MRPKTVRWLALLLALILLAVFVLFQAGFFASEKEEPMAAASTSATDAPAAIPIKALVIDSRKLTDYILVNGSTTSADRVMVSSEVPGKVQAILFTEGQYVQKGKPLIQLDDAELKAQRERLRVQAQLNEKITERLNALYDLEGVTLQETEVAQAEYDKARAELALLEVQLEKRVVRSPFSGRIGLRLVSKGSYLSPGTPIVELVNSDPIKIEFSVPEKYSAFIRAGTPLEFQVEGMGQPMKATVEATDPTIDPNTRTFRLKASAPNPKGKILPGAFASIRVNLQDYDDTILIPTEAIIPELDGKKVYVYRNGKAELIPVKTGIRQEARIQITEGLSVGDTVIITGVLQLKAGVAVTITSLE